jgi:hypothetical protein
VRRRSVSDGRSGQQLLQCSSSTGQRSGVGVRLEIAKFDSMLEVVGKVLRRARPHQGSVGGQAFQFRRLQRCHFQVARPELPEILVTGRAGAVGCQGEIERHRP